MTDLLEISGKGFRQKLGTYMVMALLVCFTVAGYLVVNAYWKDAADVSTAAAEPLDFPYLKARTLFAYWSNPPIVPGEEAPPPRKYAPVFNDEHLAQIADLPDVLDLSVAMEQTAFTRFGSTSLLSIEPGAPLWSALEMVSGRVPGNVSEVMIPVNYADTGTVIGDVITVKIAGDIMPKTFRQDGKIIDSEDPEPVKALTVVGVYKPRTIISGLVGFLPVNRVDDYPQFNPKDVRMSWPTPNTIFLHLEKPEKAINVLTLWNGIYRDFPGIDPPPLIPPAKVVWYPNLPEELVRRAASQVATPLFSNTANAFALGAIGIFAAMFVSFLDRRKELGIMKTVGIDNAHTSGVVSAEVVFAGVLGTVAGVVVAVLVARYLLVGVSGNPISIPVVAVISGALVSALILLAATYVPRAMARQGTVMELLYGRSIPIVRQRR